MPVMNVSGFERFFRLAAGLDVDKADLRRFDDFIRRKVRDLLIRGQAVAEEDGRDIIEPPDLPVTKGLQQCIQQFGKIDEHTGLRPALESIAGRPLLDRGYDNELADQLPTIAGGLAVALARVFKVIEPDMKSPLPVHWERAFVIFDLLV